MHYTYQTTKLQTFNLILFASTIKTLALFLDSLHPRFFSDFSNIVDVILNLINKRR